MTVSDAKLNPTGDPTSPWWHIDVTPLLAAMGLGIVGLIGIYSATRGRDADNYVTSFIERQGLFALVGLSLVAFLVFWDYRWFYRLAPLAYGVSVLGLVIVRFVGKEVNGATSWFVFGSFRLQPSEFSKLGLIIAVAAVMAKRDDGPMPLQELVRVMIVALIPITLVVLQPDIGTALVYGVIVAAMLLVGRAEGHQLLFLVSASAVVFGLLINSRFVGEYARLRLTSFVDPYAEARYNQNQAEIAIGNGGLTGAGFGNGTQTKSGLVPEQHTDFIFTVIGEEFGFAGGTVLLGCFAFLLWRLYRMARLAGDSFGAYLIVGIMTMFAFQMFQSVGMTMGVMPITGIPLPFVSYGGSATLTSYTAIGLAVSVHMRRFSAGIDAELSTAR